MSIDTASAASISLGGIEHPFYTRFKRRWKLINDVLAGKDDLDMGGETYLLRPSDYSDAQYQAYQDRAVFYNATARTLEGYQGAIYRKEATVTLPEEMQYLLTDADGEGNNLTQFSKSVARDVIPKGRGGLLIDYPDTTGIKTLADERKYNIRSHMSAFSPESILNWGTRRVGAKTVLDYLLIEEGLVDGISREDIMIEDRALIRLSLDSDGLYTQERYGLVEDTDVKGNPYREFRSKGEVLKPTLPGGKRLDFIPFIFIGSETFSPKPNLPPFYDLAQLNLAHYRNSADWEQAVYMIGQPTTYITGLDDTFIEENRGHIKYGSNATWLLPPETKCGILESTAPKPLIKQAMDAKEQQMIGLGARIIQDSTSRGSEAGESIMLRRSGEASQLSCIADNISDAFEKALRWIAEFTGANPEEVKYRLNKDFYATRLSHQDILALLASWQGGMISHEVALDNLRAGEVVNELTTNDEVLGQIDTEGPAPSLELEQRAQDVAEATPIPGDTVNATKSSTSSD